MAYTDDYALSQDATFQNRIEMSMIKAAIAIGNASSSGDAVVDGKRSVLSFSVLNNPSVYILRFTLAAIEAGPLTSGSTDANIDTAISSVWNAMAGVTSRD